jgi:alpha-mannosidase
MIERIYLTNHSHIDIGYTDHPEYLWPFYNRVIERAMDLIEATAKYPPEARFRYTCEVTAMVDHFLKTSSSSQVERFVKHEHAGNLDIGGMWFNFVPLLTRDEMEWTLDRVRDLRREYGFRITSAMNCDVNGLSWSWVDVLADAGIDGFSMGINEHRGRSPKRPNGFYWKGPQGRSILTWCGENYNWGRWYGIPQDLNLASKTLDHYIERLRNRDYSYPFIFLQTTGELNWGDNNWPNADLSDFVRAWNENPSSPKCEIITLTGFLKQLRPFVDPMKNVMEGDWSDWWAFGVGSMPEETSLLRQTQDKLSICRRLLKNLPSGSPYDAWRRRMDQAIRLCLLYQEHTFASDESQSRPFSAFTKGVIYRKATYVYDAATIAEELLQQMGKAFRDRMAAGFGQAVVHNPFDFRITSALALTHSYARPVPQNPPPVIPLEAARQIEDGFQTPQLSLPPGESTLVSPDVVEKIQWKEYTGEPILQNKSARLEFCRTTGTVRRWTDASGERELVNLDKQGLNGYVYEGVDDPAGWAATWNGFGRWTPEGWGRHGDPKILKRSVPTKILSVEQGRIYDETLLRFHLTAPGVNALTVTYRLEADGSGVEIVNALDLVHMSGPRSVYFTFAANLDNGKFWYDSGGIPTSGTSQIPGSCHDYVCVGRWLAVAGAKQAFLIMTPDVPLWHLGGFNYLQIKPHPPDASGGTHLISWPVNNHWEVNFPIHQERLTVRYRVRLLSGHYSGEDIHEEARRLSGTLCWFPPVRW